MQNVQQAFVLSDWVDLAENAPTVPNEPASVSLLGELRVWAIEPVQQPGPQIQVHSLYRTKTSAEHERRQLQNPKDWEVRLWTVDP